MARLERYVLRTGRDSWWQRAVNTVRSYALAPLTLKSPELVRLFDSAPNASGVTVNEASAFGVAAFFCGVTTISGDVASLPCHLYKDREKARAHPLYGLLKDSPNPEQTAYLFRQTLMLHALVVGNGYAEIERDRVGRPIALWLIDPHRVTMTRDAIGTLRYEISQPSGGSVVLSAADVVHLRGPSLDGTAGLDTVRVAREALGLAIASTEFGARFFSNGGQLGGVLTLGDVTPQARENMRKSLEQRHQGVSRAWRWFLAPAGATFTETGFSPRDSQMTELREEQVREIARFLKIPTALLQSLDRATWGNFDQQMLSYYQQCIRVWLVNLESELNMKLLSDTEREKGYHYEHAVEGFLRGDTAQRATFYTQMLSAGIMSINEARELENLPPVEGGERPRVPLNMEPLEAPPVNETEIPTTGRHALMVQAHRDLMVRALEGRVSFEIERLRKYQASPSTLWTWTNSFYDQLELSRWVEALLPAVRAHLLWVKSEKDPATVTEQFVRVYFTESEQTLRAVCNGGNEGFGDLLNRVLARWESHRAGESVDRWITTGLATPIAPDQTLGLIKRWMTPTGLSLKKTKQWYDSRIALLK